MAGETGFEKAACASRAVLRRHCEEQSDDAIQSCRTHALDCFAEPVIGRGFAPTRWLAMTVSRNDGFLVMFSEILARVGAVERLVAEREIRNDIVFDDSLEQRPLEPRWVAQAASLDPAILQANPNQNVAAKSLDDGHAFAGFAKLLHLSPQWAFRKPVQDLIDQGKTLLKLAHANPDARVDITLSQDRYLKAQAVIRRIGKVP